LGCSSGKGNPSDGVAGGQIADGQDGSPPTFDRFRRIGQIDSPDGSWPLPGELVEPRSAPSAMTEAVPPEMAFERTSSYPRQKCPKGGGSDIRTHGSEDVIDKV
jgi:hypothetical protein